MGRKVGFTRTVAIKPIAALCLLMASADGHAQSQVAQSQVLDQRWQFAPDPKAEFTPTTVDARAKWRPDTAGLSWNAQFDDLRDYAGVGWYRVTVPLLQPQASTRQLIHFGAVDYLSEVWVNGKRLGEHEGGYTPFTFDLTGKVHAGNNEILVKVFDPPMPAPLAASMAHNSQTPKEVLRPKSPKDKTQPTLEQRFDYNEIPHGKQNWYVQTSGIWQAVTLETVPSRYIEWVHVTPHNSGDVTVEARLAGRAGTGPLEATVFDPYGAAVAQLTLAVDGSVAQGKTRVANPLLWDGGHPNLYSLQLNNQTQQVHTHFGFRELTTADGRLFLNGKPFYMRAALDQDFYPQGIYTPPSAEFIRREMLASKAMGLNLLRCHIKAPDPRYLEAADETGMLVWYEIPVWNDAHHWTTQAAQRGVDTFQAEVERDWNHPSIVIQSIMNEQWGMDPAQADQRAWLLKSFHDLKQLTAPLGRLITDDSSCCSGFHLQSDFADWHNYRSIPDHSAEWARWVEEYAGRPKWLFSPYGDAITTGREPLLVSEFGNWGLPQLPPSDRLPWWFPRDFDGRELTRAAGVFDRLHGYGFDRIYPDYDALALATERHEYLALKYEIEQMRQRELIQGYVITELTDANWEANGLMSMWRQPKVFAEELGQLQQDDLVMANFATYNFTAGSAVELPLLVSHYSTVNVAGATILWQTSDGQSGALPLASTPAEGAVAAEGTLHFQAVQSSTVTPAVLRLQLVDAGGVTLAQNRYRYAVYPQAPPSAGVTVAIHDPLNQLQNLRSALVAQGVTVADAGASAEQAVWLSSALDDATTARLSQGGTVLLLAQSRNALPQGNELRILPRAGSDLTGDWVSNFNWVLSSSAMWKPLSPVIDSSLLGWEAASVMPEFVIDGLRQEDSPKVLAGVFYGWLNANRAYLADLPEGPGRMLVTTFRFASYGRDPFATTLFNQMLLIASSGSGKQP
jgi:Glycosyl hydrolases family 2, sugar binding domain/Glycosyl hydrolases family 2/Glycosyl hydrolases family 2, TIM barrel domain